MNAIEWFFKATPLFEAAKEKVLLHHFSKTNRNTNQARAKIEKKGISIGVSFKEESDALRNAEDWDALISRIQNPNVVYPEYYLREFHGYREARIPFRPSEFSFRGIFVYKPLSKSKLHRILFMLM